MRTKSEAAALVVAGKSIETFHHSTMGIFNITFARRIIAAHRSYFKPHTVLFADIRAEGQPQLDAAGVVQWLIGQREVCPLRCAELTAEQLEEPLINAVDEHGMSYIVDGIHRLVARYERGMPGYSFYAFPLKFMPRVPKDVPDQPWGEKDVVNGQLVKRR